MKNLILLTILLAFSFSCKKSDDDMAKSNEQDLVGYWEAIEIKQNSTGEINASDTGFGMIMFYYYMDAFELRDNHETAYYYQQSGHPAPDRVDGQWQLKGDSLILNIFKTKIDPVSLKNGILEIPDSYPGFNSTYKFRKRP